MASEVKRGFVRIAANYSRLALQLVLGVFWFRIMARSLGMEGVGIWGLLVALMGIGDIATEIVRASSGRELAAAYHDKDEQRFITVYNSAIVAGFGMAGLTFVVYAALVVAVYANAVSIPPEFIDAAVWVLVAKGVNTITFILASPHFDTYMASERFVWFNFWTTVDRATYIVAAYFVFDVYAEVDPARGMALYAAVAFGLSCLVLAIASLLIVAIEPRMKVDLSRATPETVRRILKTSGWNTVVATAMMLHIPLDQIIMNRFFKTKGNAIFYPASQLSSYVRIATMGMTNGLEAVSARLSAGNRKESTAQLVHHMTRLHAFVAFPGLATVLLLAWPLLHVWIGTQLGPEDQKLLPQAVPIAQILVVGLCARAISDGWVNILFGAGHIRRYAPFILAGGLLNPVLSIALIRVLPDPYKQLGCAIVYSAIFVVVHFVALPVIAARCLGIRLRDLYLPLLRPGLATLTCSYVYFHAIGTVSDWTFPRLVGVVAGFTAAYLTVSILFVMDARERQRFIRAGQRRINHVLRRPPRASPGGPAENRHI